MRVRDVWVMEQPRIISIINWTKGGEGVDNGGTEPGLATGFRPLSASCGLTASELCSFCHSTTK